jgi:hypothetical protein
MIKKYEKIFGELDDVNEVLFVCEGKYKIGYTINNRERYVISFPLQ